MVHWSRGQLLAVVLFVSVGALWGGSFVAIEMGLGSTPPLWFAGLRYLVAGLVVSALDAATGRLLPRGRAEWSSVAVVAVLVIAGYHGLLYLGETVVSGAVAAVIVSLSPVLTAVAASAVLSGESVTRIDAVGLLLGLAGVVVIAGPGGAAVPVGGVALVFAATTLFALGSVGLRALDGGLPPAALEGWGMVLGALVLCLGAVVRGEAFPTGLLSGGSLVPYLYLTLAAGVVGYLLYFDLLDRVGPVRVNLVGYLEPVGAALVSWGVLGHAPTATTGAGFVLVFAGFALASVDEPLARLRGRSGVDAEESRDVPEAGAAPAEVQSAD